MEIYIRVINMILKMIPMTTKKQKFLFVLGQEWEAEERFGNWGNNRGFHYNSKVYFYPFFINISKKEWIEILKSTILPLEA